MPMRLPTASDNRCGHCDAHVTKGFRRVYGDENDRVHRCHNCDTLFRIRAGSAAGNEVSIPDPLVAPGRHGNQKAEWSL